MNNQIEQTRAIIRFLEAGHDMNGQRPLPFLLRSFAIRADSVEEHRLTEHELRLNYYRNRLQDLLEEQNEQQNEQHNYISSPPKRRRIY